MSSDWFISSCSRKARNHQGKTVRIEGRRKTTKFRWSPGHSWSSKRLHSFMNSASSQPAQICQIHKTSGHSFICSWTQTSCQSDHYKPITFRQSPTEKFHSQIPPTTIERQQNNAAHLAGNLRCMQSSRRIGIWVATKTIPPFLRWSAIICSRSPTPWATMVLSGFSVKIIRSPQTVKYWSSSKDPTWLGKTVDLAHLFVKAYRWLIKQPQRPGYC